MDGNSIRASKALVKQYSDQAVQSFETRRKKILNLFMDKNCPDTGWSDEKIEVLLHEIAMMDSNNFFGSCGVGEREARFASKIVARRHYYMGHGIGRSGDITEIQPKAAGSSLIGQLSNDLVLDILKSIGVPSLQKCIIVPLATGMSLMLCLRTLQSKRSSSKYVLWPRVDQKSCFKCILTAGLIPIIIQNEYDSDGLTGSHKEIEEKIKTLGSESIVCIFSTTSSFAPKQPDNLLEISKLCQAYDIPHLVNNAYGIQCRAYLKDIERASKTRLDLFVSSTDKNFMVPVGGSVVCGFDGKLVDSVGKMYPGRGSGAPSTDMFITLLNLGKLGYKNLLENREQMYVYLKNELTKLAVEFGETVLNAPKNCISVAFSLGQFESLNRAAITEIGSMLFSKFVMGTRVVAPGDVKTIGSYEFKNWGAHTDSNFKPYLTASAAIGIKKTDIDVFIKHLKKVLTKIRKETNFIV
ncbi:O-phosphoseryl-tRNA(Sec) selenium transferase-like [Uloborus diversus]|uniref:O-phosphoseryl-tRNA(Sec) selenium transferase-like n=1 Tax=Uloborus diversus TaxID=327109 RepID=UPI00240A58BB|nr:O-phosphoseryl-tRNA(Sec) selenium transferase-like [Uloborus diversus]